MESKLFYCYSLNLRNKFISEGIECLGSGTNYNSQKVYWLFLKTDKTKAVLEEWFKNKK